MKREEEILLIHLGGLGDVCLSESTFLSLARHFGDKLTALGVRRFLILFEHYFSAVFAIEAREWLHLFSEKETEEKWQRIIFLGKDRRGELRERWQKMSVEELIFVDMYPRDAFPFPGETGYVRGSRPSLAGGPRHEGPEEWVAVHVEDHQLAQLGKWGIEPIRKKVVLKARERVILYPEQGFRKGKWHHENFLHLYRLLKAGNVEVKVLESHGLSLPVEREDRVDLEELTDVKGFFDEGGIFVSNDSGMAHLAGSCGLFTITVFTDFDHRIWHPRGCNLSLRADTDGLNVHSMEEHVLNVLDHFRRTSHYNGETIVFPGAEC
jgi:ADP-heptose:LPS heptosyltransferase